MNICNIPLRRTAMHFILTLCCLFFFTAYAASAANLDEETGLIIGTGFETVKEICTVCHSAQMIRQNRMDRQGWLETIRWMQETQGLQELDQETEKVILDYLATHYAPVQRFRRPPLNVEWH